jgi:hypothetical protein
MNILNKQGMLSELDRKEKLVRTCDFVSFETCLDLSKPIEMVIYGKEISLNNYSRDVASFISWWNEYVNEDLNGFTGFHNVQFIPLNFKIIM